MADSKGGRRKYESSGRHVEMVAVLASTGMRNNAIALQLGLPETTVTRLRKAAVREGRLARAPRFLGDDACRAEVEQLIYGDRELLTALEGRFGGPLRQLYVLDDGGPAGTSPQRMAACAARNLLVGVLPDPMQQTTRATPRYVGVTWGPTTALLADAVRQLMLERYVAQRSLAGIEFVQTCGDPPSAISDPSQRCSTLVAAFNASLTGKAHSSFTFSVGACISRDFADSEVTLIRRYIRGIGSYGRIFGPFEPDMARLQLPLDMLITSCGSGCAENDRWLGGCAEQVGIDPDKLERLVAGNIGGIWLPRAGLSKDDSALLETITARWNGMALQDLQAINLRQGGVVCLALEESKSGVVLELLRRRLVSRLFVSRAIAASLREAVAAAAAS